MALVTADVNWQGFGKVTNADNLSPEVWATIKTTSGGGTPGAALADGGLHGATTAQAITTTSNNKRILLYYDIGSGNELDFTASTGSEAGEFVWVWGNFLASSLLETTANNGFGIMLGTDNGGTVEWSVWSFFGSENYAGGWRRMVIDPTKTASLTGSGSTEGGGGITISSVRYFGIMAKTNATARFDNMLVDRIDVGTGYAIDGTGATADAFMSDLLSVEETVSNWWGVIQRLNTSGTAYGLTGKMILGDSVGTTATTVTDVSSKIFAEEPLYYNSGFVAALPLSATGIEVVGNGTGATSVTIGKAVGADAGRSGWTVVGNDTYDVGIDWDDGNVNTQAWYGCNFENLSGTLSWGTNTAHKLFSSTLSGCQQFDPVGGVQIRNCNFAAMYDDGTADASNNSALLWNSSINIQKCNFLANSHTGSDVAHGIEHDAVPGVASGTVTTADAGGTQLTDSTASFLTTAAVNDIVYNETDLSFGTVTSVDSNTQLTHTVLTGGTDNDWDLSDAYSVATPITYTDLVFSGNEVDVHNSTSPNNVLAVSKAGTSNPATSTGFAVFQGSVTVSFEVVDKDDAAIQSVRVTAYLVSDDTEIINTTTNASGIASTSYSGSTPADIYYRYRKSSTGATKYVNLSGFATIESGTGVSVKRSMTVDNTADPSI